MTRLRDDILENVSGGTILTIPVEEGDTLEKLAEKFHCTVDEICRWNDLKDQNVITVGQKLKFKF